MPNILFTSPSTDENSILPYKNAVEGSGGTLLRIPSNADEAGIDNLISQANGILLPGGGDVNPVLYGQMTKSYIDDINDERDTLEMRVLAVAIAKGIPTLAICRGLQILNVRCGGSLYQDVQKEMEGAIRHDWHKDEQGTFLPRGAIRHQIHISEGTLLYDIVVAREVGVDSLHHQGIRQLGGKLAVSAIAPDGLIEAVEMKDHPFLLGVQWHPESMYADPLWKHLFDVFVSKTIKL